MEKNFFQKVIGGEKKLNEISCGSRNIGCKSKLIHGGGSNVVQDRLDFQRCVLVGLDPDSFVLVLKDGVSRIVGLNRKIVPLILGEKDSVVGVRQFMENLHMNRLAMVHSIVGINRYFVDIVFNISYNCIDPIYIVVDSIFPDNPPFSGSRVDSPVPEAHKDIISRTQGMRGQGKCEVKLLGISFLNILLHIIHELQCVSSVLAHIQVKMVCLPRIKSITNTIPSKHKRKKVLSRV